MSKFTQILKISVIAAVILLFSCNKVEEVDATYKATQFSHEIATSWVDLSFDLVRTTPGYSPPVASKTYGLLGITLYESVVQGMPGYQSLSGQVTELPEMPVANKNKLYYWPICANVAAYDLLVNLFPTANADMKKVMLLTYENNLKKNSADLDAAIIAQSIDFGKEVAKRIYFWSATDAIANEAYLKNFPSSFVVPTGDGLWVSTNPSNARPLQPFWGKTRSFVPNITAEVTIPAHPAFSSDINSKFYESAYQVYEAVNGLTPEQERIAKYWADDAGLSFTPPGHVMSVASQVVKEQKLDLGRSAEAFARVGMCVGDAFVCCWKTKFEHNLLRPVTYIQKYIDPTWRTILSTPPFPAYTSGHASCSGAGFDMLTKLFGANYAFVDKSHILKFTQGEPNFEPRSFSSFKAAAGEAAISRLYGGIHYEFDNFEGLKSGEAVSERNYTKIITKK